MPPQPETIPQTRSRVTPRGSPWYRWLRRINAEDGTYDAFPAGATYTLTDARTGTVVLTQSVEIDEEDATTLALLVDTPDELEVGALYVERWDLTAGEGEVTPLPVVVDVYVSETTLTPSWTLDDLLALQPDYLTRYPRGQTTWWPQLRAAQRVIEARLVTRAALSRHDVVTITPLHEHWLYTAAAICLRAIAGGSAAILALATEYDTRAEAAWPWRLEVDTDGDGTVDDIATTTADDEGSPAVER